LEPVTLVLLAAFVAILAAMLLALYRLSVVSPGYTRNVALAFIVIVMGLDICYILSAIWSGTPQGDSLAVVTPFIQFWAAGTLLHLVNTIEQYQRIRSRLMIAMIIYLPIAITCAVVIGILSASPGMVSISYQYGLTVTEYGIGEPIFLTMGAAYAAGILAKLAFILRRGDRSIRTEIVLVVILSLAAIITFGYQAWIIPGLSTVPLSFVSTSLISIVLGYAALKGSPLVVPQTEVRSKTDGVGPCAAAFKPRTVHLCLVSDRTVSRKRFATLVKNGMLGLWVSRRPPKELRDEYGLVRTPVIWLTGNAVEGEVCIPPGETAKLSKAFSDFIAATDDYIILFEGLEYISSTIGFKPTLNLVQLLNDRVMGSRGSMIIWLDPRAFRDEEVALLRSEATEVHEEPVRPGDGVRKSPGGQERHGNQDA
jgi:hypothetical protein